MRLVVEHHEVAPPLQQAADGRVRVLARAAPHGAQHRLRHEAAVLNRRVALADPVVALRVKRDGLPVSDEHVGLELVPVLRRNHVELVVQVAFAGRIEPVAARGAAHPVAHRQIRHEDQKVRRQRRPAHLALVQRRPDDDGRHHHGLASAGRQLEGVAQQSAGPRHSVAPLHLVQMDQRLDRLLLAEEQPLADSPALLVAFEPPLQQPASHDRRTGVAGLAPRPDLAAEVVDELVTLLARGRQVVEQRRLPADDAGDAALGVLRRREKAHRGSSTVDELRPAAGQNPIVSVGFLVGVADDHAIDDVGHASAPTAGPSRPSTRSRTRRPPSPQSAGGRGAETARTAP